MSNCQWTIDAHNAVQFSGELTRDTVPPVWQERQQWLNARDHVVLNVTEVTKVDTAGVAMLVNAKKQVGLQQRELSIVGASPQLRAIISVSGVAEVLDVPFAGPTATPTKVKVSHSSIAKKR
ncbi:MULTISPECIES: lipid asymmetry maintenance protein MlaB [Idiomarinaceae]|uniref:Phospholipid transport system transporter-binding protein n=3 Tax=Pseudidiomarina TaxID=2800384 RepID=A0A368UTD7_9GAMM|nr:MULTISPECIES: STAS domain-containing protein [Idiomarinaceae]PWW13035.1 phospholipid transport system transporter-binding protein [Pseudidiomarina maritima]RBP90431.1 phospholipid transport system transporter-binding protein [Pseudidiomarina tainanensis]RCW32107.1 phospholipid transport system transporter-binding protein [Pseudidiomarina tainanensis]UUN12908.1 STAS domain-containing protein [Idiomarina loihiensis]